jgi:hypothetical protein
LLIRCCLKHPVYIPRRVVAIYFAKIQPNSKTRRHNEMKTNIVTLLLLLTLILTACSGSSTATESQSAVLAATNTQTTASSSMLNTSYDSAISIELQLLVGTLKLAGTEQAITKDQAAILLPLWQQISALNQANMPGQGNFPQGMGGPDQGGSSQGQDNGTPQAQGTQPAQGNPPQGQDNGTPQAQGIQPAQGNPPQGQDNGTPQAPSSNTENQAQIDSLIAQIEAAMTTGQIQAITDMKITQDSISTLIQDLGISMGDFQQGNGNNPGGSNPPSQGNAQGGNGQAPQGTPPAGNTDSNGQTSQGTPPADNSGNGGPIGSGTPAAGGQPGMRAGGMMIQPGLLESLIQMLAKTAGVELEATATAP